MVINSKFFFSADHRSAALHLHSFKAQVSAKRLIGLIILTFSANLFAIWFYLLFLLFLSNFCIILLVSKNHLIFSPKREPLLTRHLVQSQVQVHQLRSLKSLSSSDGVVYFSPLFSCVSLEALSLIIFAEASVRAGGVRQIRFNTIDWRLWQRSMPDWPMVAFVSNEIIDWAYGIPEIPSYKGLTCGSTTKFNCSSFTCVSTFVKWNSY